MALIAAIGLAAWHEKPSRSSRKRLRDGHPSGRALPAAEPQIVQLARANEAGRGRPAISPFEIPIARMARYRLADLCRNQRRPAARGRGRVLQLVGLFPAITALVSFYVLFADAATIGKHLAFAADLMPAGAFGIADEQISRTWREMANTVGAAQG